MRPTIIAVDKPRGMTPLEAIKKLKSRHPELQNQPIGFAGRLDPLAHGVLLLMIGEETTKQKDLYLNLPKTYEFEAVFGMATDTYDALGLLSPKVKSNNVINQKLEDLRLEDFITKKLGKQIQTYPPYSSKTVQGKPLFHWAREGKLDEIELPTREIEIFAFTVIETNITSAEELKKEIFTQIDLVSGDFRQNDIKNTWNNFFSTNTIPTFPTARFHLSASSGTYVRSLINDLGDYLGTGAIALDIFRTRVGEFSINDAQKL